MHGSRHGTPRLGKGYTDRLASVPSLSPEALMRLAFCVLTIGLAGLPIYGQAPAMPQWSRFRGPNGSGVSDRDKPPTTFGPTTNRIWQSPVPSGHSSPTVWNDLVFLTGVEDNGLVLAAYRRRDGTRLWQQRAPAESLEKVHAFSNPAASTPATDGERVYAYFGSYGLLAYDFAGKEIWRKPLRHPLPNSAPPRRRSSSTAKSSSSSMAMTAAPP